MGMKRVSLVLGSGGARGYAHIGVIEELEASGYEIVCIAGSSMGALIGGAYAAGGLRAYSEWVQTLNWVDVVRLLDITFSNATIRGNKVMRKFETLLGGDPDIEQLPLPYTAVATDLTNAKEVWFQRGSLVDAIRASIAVPGVFAPVVRKGRVLVDGGVLNPLPIIPTVSTHADLIIAVDLNDGGAGLPRDLMPNDYQPHELAEVTPGRFGVILQSMEVMQSAVTRYKNAGYGADLVIRIPKELAGFHEFHRAAELIETGRQLAKYQLQQFEQTGRAISGVTTEPD